MPTEYDDTRIRLLKMDADDWFVFERRKPSQVVDALLAQDELRELLVRLANRYEQGWSDAETWEKELGECVSIALTLEGVKVPSENRTLDRFGRLLTAGASMYEGFSFGNVLMTVDWLLDGMVPGPRFSDPWGSTRELYTVERDLAGHVMRVREWRNPVYIG